VVFRIVGWITILEENKVKIGIKNWDRPNIIRAHIGEALKYKNRKCGDIFRMQLGLSALLVFTYCSF
jgi:sRNA-binding carbon storage regulator CsrA